MIAAGQIVPPGTVTAPPQVGQPPPAVLAPAQAQAPVVPPPAAPGTQSQPPPPEQAKTEARWGWVIPWLNNSNRARWVILWGSYSYPFYSSVNPERSFPGQDIQGMSHQLEVGLAVTPLSSRRVGDFGLFGAYRRLEMGNIKSASVTKPMPSANEGKVGIIAKTPLRANKDRWFLSLKVYYLHFSTEEVQSGLDIAQSDFSAHGGGAAVGIDFMFLRNAGLFAEIFGEGVRRKFDGATADNPSLKPAQVGITVGVELKI